MGHKVSVPMNFDTLTQKQSCLFLTPSKEGEEPFYKLIVSSLRRVRTVLKPEIHTIHAGLSQRNRGRGAHYVLKWNSYGHFKPSPSAKIEILCISFWYFWTTIAA